MPFHKYSVYFKTSSQPYLSISEVDSVASYTKKFDSTYSSYSSLQVFLSILHITVLF